MECYKNSKVLIIGHTGFKGSWLVNYLNLLGAKVYGISKKKINESINYELSKVKKKTIKEYDIDVRDFQD